MIFKLLIQDLFKNFKLKKSILIGRQSAADDDKDVFSKGITFALPIIHFFSYNLNRDCRRQFLIKYVTNIKSKTKGSTIC